MNCLKIYHIDYSRNINMVTWEYQNLSDSDRITIANLQFEASIDYIDKHDNYNMIILSDSNQINKLESILGYNMINHFCNDISEKVIRNQIDLKKYAKPLEGQENLNKFFFEKIDNWISEKLDLDIVLDIINEKGIGSLREVDIKFLEKYGK